MKVTFVAVMACAASFVFADPNCNFDKDIRNFEKKTGLEAIMANALSKSYDGGHRIKKESRPMRSEKWTGMLQVEEFFFSSDDCALMNVILSVVDPKTKKYVSTRNAIMRPDGSLKAICDESGDVVVEKGNGWEVNRNCECFDYSWKKVDFGKFGCLDKLDVDVFLKK